MKWTNEPLQSYDECICLICNTEVENEERNKLYTSCDLYKDFREDLVMQASTLLPTINDTNICDNVIIFFWFNCTIRHQKQPYWKIVPKKEWFGLQKSISKVCTSACRHVGTLIKYLTTIHQKEERSGIFVYKYIKCRHISMLARWHIGMLARRHVGMLAL